MSTNINYICTVTEHFLCLGNFISVNTTETEKGRGVGVEYTHHVGSIFKDLVFDSKFHSVLYIFVRILSILLCRQFIALIVFIFDQAYYFEKSGRASTTYMFLGQSDFPGDTFYLVIRNRDGAVMTAYNTKKYRLED